MNISVFDQLVGLMVTSVPVVLKKITSKQFLSHSLTCENEKGYLLTQCIATSYNSNSFSVNGGSSR